MSARQPPWCPHYRRMPTRSRGRVAKNKQCSFLLHLRSSRRHREPSCAAGQLESNDNVPTRSWATNLPQSGSPPHPLCTTPPLQRGPTPSGRSRARPVQSWCHRGSVHHYFLPFVGISSQCLWTMRRRVRRGWSSWSRRGKGEAREHPCACNMLMQTAGRAMSGRTLTSAEEEAAWMQAFSRCLSFKWFL